jgi:hypothetical protein
MGLTNGVFTPPAVSFEATIAFAQALMAPATILRLERVAGAGIGTAVVRFKTLYAEGSPARLGDRAMIRIGGAMKFRGRVAVAPVRITRTEDEFEVILADDKQSMKRWTVGQVGIGTVAIEGDPTFSHNGFPDVGNEVYFNKGGRGNKSPSERNFSLRESAEQWTIGDALRFVFQHYVDEDDARIDVGELNQAYDRICPPIELTGMKALQAVDALVNQAGQSWGLRPGETYSEFVAVTSGSGRQRSVQLFTPRGGSTVIRANTFAAGSYANEQSIMDCADTFQVKGGRTLKETVYSNKESTGETPRPPLLTRVADFKHKKFVARFGVDVTQYALNGLGRSRLAGAKPKPWLTRLVTRMKTDGSAYLTAAEMAASTTNRDNERAELQLWIATDGQLDNAKLALGGFDVDVENCFIDFESEVEVAKADSTSRDTLRNINWANVGLWLTVATVMDEVAYAQSDESSSYLPDDVYEVIDKPDLVMEVRENSMLPDLATTTNNNARVTIAAEEENYVDVTDELEDLLDSVADTSPEVESGLDIELPFFPDVEIGDRITMAGRNVGATGNEVVTEINYEIDRQYVTRVRATNVIAGIDASRQSRRKG